MQKGVVPIFLRMSQITFVAILGTNIFLPILQKHTLGLCFGNVLVIIFWIYAFFSSLGYIKVIASQDEDGNIEYDTKVPILQVAGVRIVEFGYFMLRKRNIFLYKHFLILVGLDVAYLIFLLIDKGSYCYESCPGEEE